MSNPNENHSLMALVESNKRSGNGNLDLKLLEKIENYTVSKKIGMVDQLLRSHQREALVIWSFLGCVFIPSIGIGFYLLIDEGPSISNLLFSYGLLVAFSILTVFFYNDHITEKKLTVFTLGMIFITFKGKKDNVDKIINSLLTGLHIEFSTDIYSVIPRRIKKNIYKIYSIKNPSFFILIYKTSIDFDDNDDTLVFVGPIAPGNWDILVRFIQISREYT
jgi:hypothetical protein